jgi:cytochrome c-type biogenesis protein CcmH
MNQFIFFAALLGLLAVAFAISALWQRSRALALALAIGLPLAAAGVYYLKGEPAALKPHAAVAPKTIDDVVAEFQRKLAKDPTNFEGTVLLARSYMALGKFDLASATYAKAMQLRPEESDVSVEYAEAMLRASPDHRFPPQAVAYLKNAIEKNPNNQRALFFLGTHEMMEHQPAEAAATWEKLLPMLSPEAAALVRKQINEARLQAGQPPLPADAGAPIVSAGGLEVDVQIDPTLAKLAQPGDVLYVFARSVAGGGPPLAAKRIELGKLPLHLQLTDADSPMPAAKLSSQPEVQLMARLSKSGDVKAASGDIEADPIQVASSSKEPVTLILNRPVP